MKIHLETLSNGLGAQSMVLFMMACRREIPATVSITSDTGWESDRLWSNGRRASNRIYFDEIVVPIGKKYGIECYFVRTVDKYKNELPSLLEHTEWCIEHGKFNNIKIPLFGSKGGRRTQVCTGKWKIRAINQQLRRLGATTACTFQGIHSGESSRRVSGWYLKQHSNFDWISVYQDTQKVSVKDGSGKKTTVEKAVKWLTHAYPLVDLNQNRQLCQIRIVGEGIPYLLSSECDGCPHKDLERWERTSEDIIERLAGLEVNFNGEYFFTPLRIPLWQAIEAMKKQRSKNPEKYKKEADFGCQNAVCGV